ncbi:MAG: hypothetical protein ACRDSF_21935 [Pseudonocardiaceae bacterium]
MATRFGDLHGPGAGLSDPPEGVVLPGPPRRRQPLWVANPAGSAAHPAPPLAVRPALGAS